MLHKKLEFFLINSLNIYKITNSYVSYWSDFGLCGKYVLKDMHCGRCKFTVAICNLARQTHRSLREPHAAPGPLHVEFMHTSPHSKKLYVTNCPHLTLGTRFLQTRGGVIKKVWITCVSRVISPHLMHHASICSAVFTSYARRWYFSSYYVTPRAKIIMSTVLHATLRIIIIYQ